MGAPRLGPFILGGLLQRGGMGQVWAAVHGDTGTPVAVKVITAENARDPRFRRAFRHEVRAAAALSHPSIVTLLDVGELPVGVAEATDGALVPESPYLVMELATGGSLDRLKRPEGFAPTRRLLLSVLDGLAHAHAREVVHCDLKPGNLLLCTDQDLRPGLKITDFGLSVAMGRSPELAPTAGTPAFMAPEQFRGDWRSVGPWTDLYGLGCMAWLWFTGRPLYEGNRKELSRAHQRRKVPAFEPRYEVPAGLDAWLRALLVKRTGSRVQRAADAAAALSALGLPDTLGDEPEHDWTPTALQPSATEIPDSEIEVLQEGLVALPLLDEEGPPALRPPPLPDRWGMPGAGAAPVQLAGAGLELFGYRAIPVVGRTDERDALWEALQHVSRQGTARAVALRGPGGVGKSRLAAWLCHRADEVGGATWMHASHEPKGSPSDGLPGMLSGWLSARGLSGEALRGFLRRRIPRGVAPDAVASLMAEAGQRVQGLRFTRPEERWRLARRLLAHQATSRPLVVWLDDVQWGADAIDFVQHVLDRPALPILFVLTVQDDALLGRPAEADALDDLLAHDRAREIRVTPLTDDVCAELVRSMLPVDAQVAHRVAERAEGNPLFAVQLLGEWVQSGWVTAGRAKLRLDDATGTIPSDLHDLWLARLTPALARLPEGALEALELAAVLGVEVTGKEWKGAAHCLDIEVPEGLSAALLDAGLATGSEGRWRFAHGLLRESLEHRAAESGRLVAHHEACAEMLEGRLERVPGALGRRARHLLAAGHNEQALPMLLEAARERVARGDTAQALALIGDHDAVVRTLDLPEQDPRAAEGALLRIEIKVLHEAFLDARDAARRLSERAERYGWAGLRARALRVEGMAHFHAGRLDEAADRYAASRRAFRELDDADGEGSALCGLGHAHRLRGDLAEAASCYRATLDERDRITRDATIREALLGLGMTRYLQGDPRGALPLLTEALELARAAGAPRAMVSAHTVLGEVARASGEQVAALEHYQRAAELDRGMGRDAIVPRLNLAVMMVLCERYQEGRVMLEDLEITPDQHLDLAAPFIRCGLLVCDAHAHDWRSYDEQLIDIRAALTDTGVVEPDLGRLLHTAGRAAARAGQRRRAQVALAAALSQWRALGDEGQVQAVRSDMLGIA